jgi:Fe-S oxidoreductase
MKLENVIATTENCRYCLMCRHVCPVGHVTMKESLTPHGWGLTIASVERGLLAWNASTVEALYSCADCGTCRAHCVTDQPLPAAIAAARADVAAADMAPATVYETHATLAKWDNPFGKAAPEPAAGTGEVALFVGDEAHFLDPEGVDAAVRLLRAAGVEPVLIGVGRNNGYLAISLGFPQTGQALLEATRAELQASGARRLLVLTPGDWFALSKMADERLGLAWPEAVVLEDVAVVLAEAAAAGKLRFRQSPRAGLPYAYVDPNHTVRVPERVEAPRRLLQTVMGAPGKELYWRRDRAHPTGNVALQYTLPHLADHLTWARMGDARQAGAQLLVTEEAGSLAQLRRNAGRFGLQVESLYPFLANHLLQESP